MKTVLIIVILAILALLVQSVHVKVDVEVGNEHHKSPSVHHQKEQHETHRNIPLAVHESAAETESAAEAESALDSTEDSADNEAIDASTIVPTNSTADND